MSELATRMEQGRAVQQSGGGRNVFQELEALRPQIERALPRALNPDRFLRLVLTQVRTAPALLACSTASLLGAVMSAAQLGLEIDSRGLAYLIPRKGQVTLQIGYKGMIDLATRSGRTLDVDAEVVYENEFFRWEKGLTPKLKHKPLLTDRGAPIAAYAVAHYANGGASFTVLPVADIERRRGRGEGSQPAWKTDWEAMAKKTAVRALSAYMPQNPEMALAIKLDDTVRTDVTTPVEELPEHSEDDTSSIEDAEVQEPEDAGGAHGAGGDPQTGSRGPHETRAPSSGQTAEETTSPLPSSAGVEEGAVDDTGRLAPSSAGAAEDDEVSAPPSLESLRADQLRALCDESKVTNIGTKPQMIERLRTLEAKF